MVPIKLLCARVVCQIVEADGSRVLLHMSMYTRDRLETLKLEAGGVLCDSS